MYLNNKQNLYVDHLLHIYHHIAHNLIFEQLQNAEKPGEYISQKMGNKQEPQSHRRITKMIHHYIPISELISRIRGGFSN